MTHKAKQIAENASFQAFVNSYLREVNKGHLIEREEWVGEQQPNFVVTGTHIVELQLPHQALCLAIEIEYASIVGRHSLGKAFKYDVNKQSWYQEDRLSVMMLLTQELHLQAKSAGRSSLASHYDELILRLIESYHTMTTYVEKRNMDVEQLYSDGSRFIDTEQSLLFGHWLHPTPKSRQGMANWQHDYYAPELCGRFQLHYFSVKSDYVEEASVLEKAATSLIKEELLAFEVEEGFDLIPMHPLQAQWLLQQPHVKEAIKGGIVQDLGPLGEVFTPTSSIRTVYSEKGKWMYKFSIPVKVTNSLRVNRLHELKAGVIMASLLKKINFLEKYPSFRVMDDPAYVTVALPGHKETGFEVIIRSNLFPTSQDKGITSIAALVQDTLPGCKSRLHQLITNLATSERRTNEEVSMNWFRKYWACSIDPLIRLFDEHGIALEAHQQNSVLDLSTSYPTAYYYRDNQGFYLSANYAEYLLEREPNVKETPDLFYENHVIEDRFAYYLFMNQLFSIIHRFGLDGLIKEERLVEEVRNKLKLLERELSGAGKKFVQLMLYQPTLAFKANLLTRFHDVDELEAELEQAVYTTVTNPFVVSENVIQEEGAYASAVML
ncbi:IucA/IucC family protein [Metabacillus iocasae]|uniref:Siderophore synthetase component n=1 Tax=Priestia iocasae TaxID=2291674 RepID=A0ABS2R008_9BACI|nr:IucA/IucC family protein [Metabacillus iocasae]MBM7704547.1 siderophore synthetase component [Metabacillus iocasae]